MLHNNGVGFNTISNAVGYDMNTPSKTIRLIDSPVALINAFLRFFMKYVKVARHNIIPHIDKIDITVLGLIINNYF